MTSIPRKQLKVGRVLSQDKDFAIVEVGKHNQVTFNLQQNDDGETVGGDTFLTLVFVKADAAGTSMQTWDPFGEP